MPSVTTASVHDSQTDLSVLGIVTDKDKGIFFSRGKRYLYYDIQSCKRAQVAYKIDKEESQDNN